MDRYANRPAARYDVTPLEMAVLCALYHNMGGLDLDGIHAAAARFAPARRRVAQLLRRMERRGLVEAAPGGTYELSPACVDRHFDTAALGGRAGGELHVRTISAMQDRYSRYGYYTRMDTGGNADPMPDLEVCEPAARPDGGPDPERWGRRVAVEVEAGPSRHPNRPGTPGAGIPKLAEEPRCDGGVVYRVHGGRPARHRRPAGGDGSGAGRVRRDGGARGGGGGRRAGAAGIWAGRAAARLLGAVGAGAGHTGCGAARRPADRRAARCGADRVWRPRGGRGGPTVWWPPAA